MIQNYVTPNISPLYTKTMFQNRGLVKCKINEWRQNCIHQIVHFVRIKPRFIALTDQQNRLFALLWKP